MDIEGKRYAIDAQAAEAFLFLIAQSRMLDPVQSSGLVTNPRRTGFRSSSGNGRRKRDTSVIYAPSPATATQRPRIFKSEP